MGSDLSLPIRKVGFFGGSFDPIHLGHLNLAIQILEQRDLDEILFCPALLSPAKQKTPPIASPRHRLNMLRLSLEDLTYCIPYEAELIRPPPSFTIETVGKIQADQVYLIMGEDSAYGLGQWKQVDELLHLASPLVGTRFGYDTQKLSKLPPFIKSKVEEGLCPIQAMDISSSGIRERLKNKQYCGHLLQGKVLDYIHQNGLYCNSKI